ncbi:MAG: DUF6673 family protein [Lachnospiraceae bacterium]
MFEVNGVQLNLDIAEADDMGRLEEANVIAAELKDLSSETGKEVILKSCGIVNRYIVTLFGEEAAQKICGESKNMLSHLDWYEVIVDEVKRQSDLIVARTRKNAEKANRAQRRAKK